MVSTAAKLQMTDGKPKRVRPLLSESEVNKRQICTALTREHYRYYQVSASFVRRKEVKTWQCCPNHHALNSPQLNVASVAARRGSKLAPSVTLKHPYAKLPAVTPGSGMKDPFDRLLTANKPAEQDRDANYLELRWLLHLAAFQIQLEGSHNQTEQSNMRVVCVCVCF